MQLYLIRKQLTLSNEISKVTIYVTFFDIMNYTDYVDDMDKYALYKGAEMFLKQTNLVGIHQLKN